MVNWEHDDEDPEADPEVLIISETFWGIDPLMDPENVKIKEEKKKEQVRWWCAFLVYFSFFHNICMLSKFVCSED